MRKMRDDHMTIIPRDPQRLARNENDPDFEEFLEHIGAFIQPPIWAGIDTPDLIQPDASTLGDGVTPRFILLRREVSTITRKLTNDGISTESVNFMGFNHKDASRFHFTSEPIRVVEGQIVHAELHHTSRGPSHTIHWHGIEPTSMNDGVGKISMEVGSSGYTYQWQANAAGTYFYHCHRNTILHFMQGMYGVLIVDVLPPPGSLHAALQPLGNPVTGDGNQFGTIGFGYPMGGPGFVRRGGNVVPYDVEAIWVTGDIDPVWAGLSHNHGMGSTGAAGVLDSQGNDLGARFSSFDRDDPMGLHRFNPTYFCISGVPHPWTLLDELPPEGVSDGGIEFLPPIPATVAVGQTLLVRLICGAYSLTEFTFQGLDVEVIGMDGRTLGHPPFCRYSAPFRLAAGVPFELTTARRFDLLITPTAAQVGSHRVQAAFRDHVNHRVLGIAETLIHVVDP
jgi:hypothetical protein